MTRWLSWNRPEISLDGILKVLSESAVRDTGVWIMYCGFHVMPQGVKSSRIDATLFAFMEVAQLQLNHLYSREDPCKQLCRM